MTVVTKTTLQAQAEQVRSESQKRRNTADRVGQVLLNIIDSVAVNLVSIITSATDTGAVDTAYTGGVLPVPTTSGNTTSDTFAVLASQNCRSMGLARAVSVGSIYCWSKGNVSGCYSARQCNSWVPQSVNVGSEECWVRGGFRGGNYSSIYCGCEGESNANVASRSSHATGRNASNVSSSGSFAGRGGGAYFEVTTTAGVVTGIEVKAPGTGYLVGDALFFFDRASAGTGAVVTVATIDGSGGILTLLISDGGSGYSAAPNVDCVVDNGTGDFSANVATVGCTTSGVASANVGADSSTASADGAVNLGTDTCVASATFAVNIGSDNCTASGVSAANIAASGNTASGGISATLASNLSTVSAQGAVVIGGRRVLNDVARSVAGGNAAAGVADAANRTWHLKSDTGEVIGKVLRTFAALSAETAYTVATVPAAATFPGGVIYVSNGDTGAPCLAVSNGTNWLRIALGAAVAT